MVFQGWWQAAGAVVAGAAAVVLQGCTAVTAGQLVQAGYDAAKTSLTSSSGGSDAARERTVMNALSVGQELAPVLDAMGVPPKEKSGNLQGYVCYQYAGVYSATEDAVIVARDGKIVFFGSSSCKNEMQAGNFNAGGKYATGASAAVGASEAAGASAGTGAGTHTDAPAASGALPGPASAEPGSPASSTQTGNDESPATKASDASGGDSAAPPSGNSTPDVHGQ